MVRPWYWPEGGQPHRTEPFTWIIKGKMAASWWPDPPVFEIYKKEGIKVIINCSEFDYRNEIPEGYKYYHINISDYGIPSESQLNHFLEITEKHGKNKEPIVVHCVAGCGRTGQMIVAWGSANGIIPKNMDPVKWIRSYRKCSLETKEQMALARRIANKLKK
ncbi:MAG: protein-tyrosine phosphatase family protein [Promethearchaeota archaeon]